MLVRESKMDYNPKNRASSNLQNKINLTKLGT